MHKRTFGLKIFRDEAFRIALGTCCMNLAAANKLNCMCDELITIISLVDRIQGRAGRLQTDNHRAQEKVLRRKIFPVINRAPAKRHNKVFSLS